MGKLVRDRIPEIIKDSGGDPNCYILTPIEYREALIDKLKEEVDEFIESRTVEELADILEVIKCIYVANENEYCNVFLIGDQKRRERGSFYNRIYLED